MQLVETAYHYIRSSAPDKPEYSCQGGCRKVWWRQDLEDQYGDIAIAGIQIACPQCKGQLKPAIEGQDYSVLSNTPGGNGLDGSKVVINNAAWVKPAYIAKAMTDWV